MKARRAPLEFPLPMALVARLERYIATFRQVLCLRSNGGPPTSRLWVSNKGTPLPDYSIYLRIVTLTRARFGHPINPHLFRDADATTMAVEDPDHVRLAAPLLGHRSPSPTERHYQQAKSLDAHRRFLSVIKRRGDR